MCEMKIRDGKKKIEIQCKDVNKVRNFVYRNDKIARLSTMSMRVSWPLKRTFDVPCLLFHCTSYR